MLEDVDQFDIKFFVDIKWKTSTQKVCQNNVKIKIEK
jgi:hypothetical protein